MGGGEVCGGDDYWPGGEVTAGRYDIKERTQY